MKYIITSGISDSCDIVLNEIWKTIESDIQSLKSNSMSFNIDRVDIKCKDISFTYNIQSGLENLCNGQSLLKDSKIIDGYLTNVSIKLDIVYSDMNDEFVYYVKSVILHELVHIFQHYNLLVNNKFRPESFSIGSIIPQLRKIVDTKYGEYLLDVLYYSLSHELSTQLHQYYLYKLNNKNYNRLDSIEKIIKGFKIINLSKEQIGDVYLIKNHMYNSIKYLSTNKKYLRNLDNSIWNEKDIYVFLNKLKSILDKKVNWISKKKNLIDGKIKDSKIIRYDENTTLPHNWEFYDILERSEFIRNNINDPIHIYFI